MVGAAFAFCLPSGQAQRLPVPAGSLEMGPRRHTVLAAKLRLPSPPSAARSGPGLHAAGPGQASALKAEHGAAGEGYESEL